MKLHKWIARKNSFTQKFPPNFGLTVNCPDGRIFAFFKPVGKGVMLHRVSSAPYASDGGGLVSALASKSSSPDTEMRGPRGAGERGAAGAVLPNTRSWRRRSTEQFGTLGRTGEEGEVGLSAAEEKELGASKDEEEKRWNKELNFRFQRRTKSFFLS